MASTDKILRSLGVPALIYKDPPTTANSKITDNFIANIDTMLREGKSIFFNLRDGVEGSKLAAVVLRAAIEEGYLKARYITPENIADSKAESWDSGDKWQEYLDCDLLVIDRIVFTNLDNFKLKSLYDLIEKRLLNQKSTLMVSEEDVKSNVPDRVKNLFNHAEVKLVRE